MVDDSPTARGRITLLLQLGGWQVHQAVGAEDALHLAALVDPGLVVTDMVMRNGHGPPHAPAARAGLRRPVPGRGRTPHAAVPRARRGAGALACLAKPVDPRLFVDVMRGLAPAAASAPVRENNAPVETGTHSEEMFLSALPHRLSAIAISAQVGDAAAVAAAADTLAVASSQLGHDEVAFLSHTIARDARRGMVTHGRLVAPVGLCARLDAGSALVGQAATRR